MSSGVVWESKAKARKKVGGAVLDVGLVKSRRHAAEREKSEELLRA